jgi:hypothetical protein
LKISIFRRSAYGGRIIGIAKMLCRYYKNAAGRLLEENGADGKAEEKFAAKTQAGRAGTQIYHEDTKTRS